MRSISYSRTGFGAVEVAWLLIVGVAMLCSSPRSAKAQCPACANPSFSGGEHSEGNSRYDSPIQKGGIRMDVNFQYHALTRLVHGDDYISFSELTSRSSEAAEHGDAESYIFRTDLIGRYGLSDRSALFLNVPYKVLTMRADIDDEHHRDETFQGVGDIPVAIKCFLFAEPSVQIAAILGLSLPVGRLNKVTAASYLSHQEAEELGVAGLQEHSHLQLGTGTFDPFVGAEALYRFDGNWMFLVQLSGYLPFYENKYGYQKSPNGTMTLGPAVNIGSAGVIVGLFGEFFYSGRDRLESDDIIGSNGMFDGSFAVPNTGRFEAALLPTMTWGVTENLTMNLEARIPVYTHIREDSEENDVQLTEHVGGFIGISYSY